MKLFDILMNIIIIYNNKKCEVLRIIYLIGELIRSIAYNISYAQLLKRKNK